MPVTGEDRTGRQHRFTSQEARCAACEVYGGPVLSCVPEHELPQYPARFGRPCPRVLLDPDNLIPFDLLARQASEHDPLYEQWLPLRLDALGLAPLDRLRYIERAMNARSHPIVTEYQERQRESAHARASKRP